MRIGFAASGVAACLAGTMLASPAWAQQPPARQPAQEREADEDEPTQVGEIVVTGQRVDEPVATGILGDLPALDTPFSVSTYSQELIDAQGSLWINDVLKNDPAQTSVRGAASYFSFPIFRGFRADQVYDGFASSRTISTGSLPLNALERVDVLRGPSGFLYGSGADPNNGGTVNLVPKMPTAEAFATVGLDFVERGYFEPSLDLNVPLAADGSLGARLNVAYGRGDGPSFDQEDTRDLVDLAIRWQPSPNLTLSGVLDYSLVRTDGYRDQYSVVAGVQIPRPPDPRINNAQHWSFISYENVFGYLRADWEFSPGWTLTGRYWNGFGYSESYLAAGTITILNAAGDTRLVPFALDEARRGPDHVGNLELRGSFRTGPLTHNLAVTAAYANYEGVLDFTPALGVTILSNLYRPIQVPRPAIPIAPTFRSIERTSQSVAVSDLIEIGDRVSVLVGVRHLDLEQTRYRLAPPNDVILNGRDKALLPTAAILFKPTSNTSLYASYTEGLLFGGQAPASAANAFEVLPLNRTFQYEIGGKIEFGAARLSVAAFEIEQALEYLDFSTDPRGVFGQFGRQNHRGIEVSLQGEVVPGVSVTGGFLILDPEQRDTGNALTEGRDPSGVPRFH